MGRRALLARARLLRDIRRFFDRRGFVEVDPPVRVAAPAPEAWIDPIPVPRGALRTSPELQMKRLVAAGHRLLYALGPVFRSGERGPRHAEEFTMLEWYRARADYRAIMTDCEALLRFVSRRKSLKVGHARVRLSGRFERRPVVDALEAVGVDARSASDEAYSEAMGLRVEPTLGLGRPTFLVDYPLSQDALARPSPKDPTLVERFELYVAGLELANGWSELVDPAEQRARFERDRERRRMLGKTVFPLDEAFLADLGHCPPCAGVALGVDRLLMVLLGAQDIAEVRLFPDPT